MEPSVVSRADLESLLDPIAWNSSDPRAGIFGPDSITWHINRESAVFLAAGRAALLQIAHPWVAAALAQHSTLLGDPVARFHNTFRVVYTIVFGGLGQALSAARHLHTLHTRIQGTLPEAVTARFTGGRYLANDVAALRWVYATLVESAILAYEAVLPLDADDRERYYQQSKTMAALFGIPSAALPVDWAAFTAYTTGMMTHSGILGVSSAAQSLSEAVLAGAGSWIRPPRWYRALTVSWLPEPLRNSFGFHFDQRSADSARHWLPRVYRALPGAIRFVGPYHEAQARLRGRASGVLARAGNRFWIGRPLLPFGSD
jgi:uncharacterized protein (DUF2236 family)